MNLLLPARLVLLLLAGSAEAHLVAFPHTVELRFEEDYVDVLHVVQIHPGEQAELLGPRALDDLEATGQRVAARLAEGGPRLDFGSRAARCVQQEVRASARRSLDVRVRLRCERPAGRLDVVLQGASRWSTGLVPITVQAPLLTPSLEGEGAPLAGRDSGPWVGGLTADATLRFVVPEVPGRVAPSEEP